MVSTRILLLVLALALGGATTCLSSESDEGNRERIVQAMDLYRAALDTESRVERVERFKLSEAMFRQVVESTDDPSAELWVCLGNAALGAERLGSAIHAFRSALVLEPNLTAAQQNLTHARSLLPDSVPTPDPQASLGGFIDRFVEMPQRHWLSFALAAFLFASGSTAIYLVVGTSLARNAAVASTAVWLTLLIASFLSGYSNQSPIVVVIADEVFARSADSYNAPVRIPDPLPGGTELTLIEDRGDWLRVRLFDSREAWLPDSVVDKVSGSSVGRDALQ